MNFYDYKTIKESLDCRVVARDILHLTLSADSRTAAVWRNGTNTESVSITKDGWHDFGSEESGSVIDLVAKVKFDGNIMDAQEFLGKQLNLTPAMTNYRGPIGSSERYDTLVADGYREVKRYNYTDENGNLLHQVVRMEHPEKQKEFLQCTPKGWGLRDVEPVLYNLPVIRKSDWMLLVEGEKDADNLIALNLPATTLLGGAKKWHERYRSEFAGKEVVILPDNDEAGKAHASMIAKEIIDVAKSVRIVSTSDRPKGDVSDFFADGHSWQEVAQRIAEAKVVTHDDLADAETDLLKTNAKEANQTPFRNYTQTRITLPGGRVKTQKTPRQINDLIADVFRRFCGFPRKVGDQLFDHDHDSRRIVHIERANTFFAWIQRKSGQTIEWAREEGCVTREELFEGVRAAARRYEAISGVPDYPKREDVYYTHEDMPKPDPEHRYFNEFISFFAAADEDYTALLKTFVSAPLFYMRAVPRPIWIIDSIDGAGSGKTKLVEAVAELYGSAPISTTQSEMSRQPTELIKRVVSSSGRMAKLLLLDNVTGNFSSPELADMSTKTDLCGRPAYGSGEEVRPNNLVYVITANSANVDNDIASRAYYIYLKKPTYQVDWTRKLWEFIGRNRLRIIADIIDILGRAKTFDLPPATRCPEFEKMILTAHCRDSEQYSRVIHLLSRDKSETNVEEETAKQIAEVIRYHLIELTSSSEYKIYADKFFIRSEVVEHWVRREKFLDDRVNIIQAIRNYANVGLMPMVDKKIKRYPRNMELRRSGILWNEQSTESDSTVIVGRAGNGKFGIVALK